MKEQQEVQLNTRPPIVVVMGHIDHGKTKILDYFRNTKVVESESGGITQHIGAYEVAHQGKKITFIDTPGHEAFSKIRSRGAKIADIAVLVVAADEGIKPQTKEALDIIKANNLPFIVAINKIDKPEANPARIKQQLAELEVLVESYGGKVPSVEISAKAGTNMDALLEIILLVAELLELKTDAEKPAEGVVIEVNRDARRGVAATLLVLNGTFRREYVIVVGRVLEKIKIMDDFLGKPIKAANASSPVLIAGIAEVPNVGDTFRQFKTRGEAEKYIDALPTEESEPLSTVDPASSERPVFNIVLKADGVGSQEALEESLMKLQTEAVGIKILRSAIGDVNESDVKLAQATKLVTIVGFKVKVDSSTRELAEKSNMHIRTGEVIYELLDAVKKDMEELLPPEIRRTSLGRIKILKFFKKEGNKQIVGGRVEEGTVKKGARVEVRRLREVVGKGTITQLQREKLPAEQVEKGLECGMMIESNVGIQEGDVLDVFHEEIIKRTL